MKLNIKKGATDQTVYVFIPNSAVTTGAGLTGLTYNSAGLTCYYVRPGAAAAQLTLVTQTATGAHADGGFVEVDATNMPGVYRLDLSDAIVASGASHAVAMLKGASNMTPVAIELQLLDYDPGAATTELADGLLKRDMSAVTGESARSPLNALRALRNRFAVSGTTYTVYKEDDTTASWTAEVTPNASANPITASDPT